MNNIAFIFPNLFSNLSKQLIFHYFFIFVSQFRQQFFATNQYGKYTIALQIDNLAEYDLQKLNFFSTHQWLIRVTLFFQLYHLLHLIVHLLFVLTFYFLLLIPALTPINLYLPHYFSYYKYFIDHLLSILCLIEYFYQNCNIFGLFHFVVYIH